MPYFCIGIDTELINMLIVLMLILLCYYLECPKSDFKCGNGSCLPIERTCDGTTDCYDESGEEVFLCEPYFNT